MKITAFNRFSFPDTFLESDSSLWLSLDHSRVAYLSYHYEDVTHNEEDDKHGGDLDPDLDLTPDIVTLNVVQLSDLKTWNVTLSESFTSTNNICVDTCHVSGVTWLTRDNILVTWLDIDKQIMIITSCSLEHASCKMVKDTRPLISQSRCYLPRWGQTQVTTADITHMAGSPPRASSWCPRPGTRWLPSSPLTRARAGASIPILSFSGETFTFFTFL